MAKEKRGSDSDSSSEATDVRAPKNDTANSRFPWRFLFIKLVEDFQGSNDDGKEGVEKRGM